jgi:predicted lipid-binding transport protein (Tim44 family)
VLSSPYGQPSGLFPANPPSGLFPSGPPRPTYREPHPVRGGGVAAGLGAGALWMLLFGLLGGGLRAYVWWTVLAGTAAWLVALALARYGDRGAAIGVAIVTGIGLSIAAVAVALRWGTSGDWPMW